MKIKKIMGLILLLVLFVVLTLGGVCMALPFTPGIFLVLWIFVAIVCALTGGFRRKEPVAGVLRWTLAPILGAWVLSGLIVSNQGADTQQVAYTVVAAIDRYQATNGAPPASLDRLVPAYFNSVPVTSFGLGGTEFFYHPRSNGFRLSYGLPYFMTRSYDSDTRRWKSKD
jgi:hypothetical protein